GDAGDDPLGLAGADRIGQAPFEGDAVDKLEHQVRRAVLLAVVVDRDDVWVTGQPRRGPGLDLEAPKRALRFEDLRPQHLDRDVAVKSSMIRLVDRREAAAPDGRDDLVGPAPTDRRWRHRHPQQWKMRSASPAAGFGIQVDAQSHDSGTYGRY